MKNILVIMALSILLNGTVVQAAYFRIEEKEDLERVSNNVRLFSERYSPEIQVFIDKKENEYKTSLTKIFRDNKPMINYIKKYPKAVIEDIDVSLNFLSTNSVPSEPWLQDNLNFLKGLAEIVSRKK